MGRNARPRRGAASSGPATAAAPPKKSITTKQRASKNTGQKTSAQAGRVSKNIHVPKKKRDEEPDDEEQDEDVPKKKGATKRKRDEEPDDEEQDEDDEEAGQDDESDSELSVSGPLLLLVPPKKTIYLLYKLTPKALMSSDSHELMDVYCWSVAERGMRKP